MLEGTLLRRTIDNSTSYKRDVDDIICLVDETVDLDSLLAGANTVHPNLNFKLEVEKIEQISFLDLALNRRADGSLQRVSPFGCFCSFPQMAGFKWEDPTLDVNEVEKYRLAFLMQFFVQHKRRFRFPRLRLQDLYQRVVNDTDVTAFCDLVARILRFLSHGDPEICIDTVDQALDRFTMDKRTPYRINMQRHRNGKPVHQLGATARTALLDNLIESVYDEQPDFNFTSGFNSSHQVTSGLSNGTRHTPNGPNSLDPTDVEGASSLFGQSDLAANETGDYTEPEDVNVLIKAGQDAQGCSYYYMDDLRLYRERPQSGISSQWDVAVGPTTSQWQAFIMSLSRNEKEYDLYCFLKQDLFELVKQSLDSYELHVVNSELDSNNLRAKEAAELVELRRRRGLSSSKLPSIHADTVKFSLTTAAPGMGTGGPKSASPAFSGGHGACGVGSSGSTSSGAPLTPSSARTPTSAPPATASSGCLASAGPQPHHVDTPGDNSEQPCAKFEPGDECGDGGSVPVKWSTDSGSDNVRLQQVCDSVGQPHDPGRSGGIGHFSLSPAAQQLIEAATPESCAVQQPSSNRWLPRLVPAPASGLKSDPFDGLDARSLNPVKKPTASQPLDQPSGVAGLLRPDGPTSNSLSPTTTVTSVSNSHLPQQSISSVTSQAAVFKQQIYTFDPSTCKDISASEFTLGRSGVGTVRSVPPESTEPISSVERPVLPGVKSTIGPATALVPPMVGLPDGGPTLTQEQWENRKMKIAQLEKIQSTLSKSKSASTPGAVAAAAGAVLQQQQQQQRCYTNGPPISGPVSQLPTMNSQQLSAGASVGFVQSPYPATLRQGIPDAHPGGRLSGVPPTEMAQREWDRLCMDYQREKGEPPGPRIPLSSRQSAVYDSNGYPIVPADVGMPPSGAVMLPSGQFIMDHPSCQLPPRHYSTQIDGVGPPVVMVPPNNSNPTVAGSPYPVTAAGPMSSAPVQQYRYMSSMGHACQEPIPTGLPPSGQKRPYYGPSNEPWPPSNSGAMMTSMPTNDGGIFPGSLPSPGIALNQRVSTLGSVVVTVPSSIQNVPVPAIVTGSTNSRGVGKAGGKKRKTAGSGRSNSTAIPTTSVAAVLPQQQQQQQLYAYSKPSTNSISSPLTPSKPLYPAPYMADPAQEVTGGPSANRPIGASGLPIESRRSVTPKSGELFSTGPTGPSMPPMLSGRVPSNCGMPFLPSGLCNNNPMTSPYMHSPDGSGFSCEMNPGMRPPTSCTQHLTSASLASLARLSQLSGPEGPYVPSSSSSALGSSLGPSSGAGGYSGRPYHPDSSAMPGPPQVMRGHPVAPSAVTMRSHESDLACSSGLSHSIPSPLLHSKFGPQMYHGPTQPQHQQQQSQSISSQSLLPPPPPPQQQSQSQQPPSIQVNNTFFNAQLNVQQMNYQHVSAPGSTGQMQIHFVQQHHDQSGGPNTGVRSSRQPDSTTRMNSGSGNGDFYPSAAQPNHLCSYGSDPGVPRAHPYSNQSGPNELQVKNDGSVSTCNSLPPVSVNSTAPGYGNTSIQITPRTPHTIQYLPTVAPSHSETQHPLQAYNSSDSPQTVRSRIARSGSGSNQIGSTESAPFNSVDQPPSETARQVPFNPGPMYSNHSSANLHMASHSQQQQYGSQPMSQSAYSQPVNPNKTVLQQHISARSGANVAVSWGDPADRHFDCHPSAPPVMAFASSGPLAANTGQSMSVAPGGRSAGPPCHQSTRANPSAYPPGYLAESSELAPADPSVSGWSTDLTGGPFSNRPGPTHYGRHHSSANRQDCPQQSYRQQQFAQQQQQQQQQHHQMFMSSSISNFSDGNNASGQVQFMMSASSSSSSMSTTNVQTSSSILASDVNTCATSTSSVGGTSVTAEPRSSSMCNLSSGLKGNSQYETVPFVSSKRNVLVSGSSDDLKATGASGPGPFIAGLSSQHVLQSGCSRMSWQPTSSIPCGASVPGDPHLGGPYSNSYGTTSFPTASSVTMLGPSNNSTVGFPDTPLNSRDLLGHHPASNCDLSTGLPQPFSSIVP
ncbi:uncharacterized protein DEA37_0009500 [Paragonimus westermani]|uniref:Uncharacterized protein n=1 Tax=Paragonimus westermani TaxID=34504 RepID=A0A5J4P3D8_9TREM|nr:uncharacterized protein DEA37_0009500 [Paragonimus westermani]